MKKFLSFLIVLIVIVGGCAAYFFLSNDKMMVGVVKEDKEALSTTLNNAIKKTHAYGNFNFSYSQEDKETKTKTDSQILVKFDGENRYFSAEVTRTEGDKKTTTSYYCEAKNDVATIYEKQDKEKKFRVATWNSALDLIDAPRFMLQFFLENDFEVAKSDVVEYFKSSSVTFSFKPFYYAAKLETIDSGVNAKFDISNRGILRKIEFSTSETNESLILNKPGKAVSINSLSAEQKKEYSLLG